MKTKTMNALKFSAVLGLLIFTEFGWAGPLDTWTWRNPLPTANNLHAVTYGNGQFVAVGDTGTIMTSTDGVTWVQRQSGTSYPLYGIAYGNGQFVAVASAYTGAPGTIVSSADGVNWVQQQSGTTYGLIESRINNGYIIRAVA